MSAILIERIRKSRQISIKIGELTLTCRRPTDLEMLELRGKEIKQGDILTRFVEGWEGMRELDLVPGGTGAPVPFSPELFAEWVADRPQSWGPICNAVIDGYRKHEADLEESLKN